MGKIRIYPPVKIFTAVTFTPGAPTDEIYNRLERLLSPIDSRSLLYSFDKFSKYYTPEMGTNLQKQMVSFLQLKPAESLVDIKIATNSMEEDYQLNNGRMVNIDAGYVCAAKMVLATTKDYDHRIYLNRSIFGDVHLRFQKGHFQINQWTYPDYQQFEIINFFEDLRRIYVLQLKEW